ncbi:peptidoglycan-binding protein [Marinicella sp. W31]|uniref:peptidoglycan-binding domain-containing protein n=1 Tax=Marinicella sp. W31 TaxID=3023713 RepID=UPI003756348C
MNKLKVIVLASIAIMGVSGCSHKKSNYDDAQAQGQRIAELEQKLAMADQKLKQAESENTTLKNSQTQVVTESNVESDLLPPNAKPGECYARILKPATYKTMNKEVLKTAASEKIEVVEATYDWFEERVLVQEASEKLSAVPAVYDWVEEQVLVEPEREEIISHPVTYKTISEQILVKPAYTTWKKGRGPIEKIDDTTGEIMCLVEVPAEYQTISKKIVDQQAYTQTRIVPAVYKTVKKKVMVQEPRVVKEAIPAEYTTIKVKKMVSPAKENKYAIPAEYKTVTERHLVTPAQLQWESILCETNTTPRVISSIQSALNTAGYQAGSVDGVMGQQTMSALRQYQKDQGLAEGKITLESLKKLGVL